MGGGQHQRMVGGQQNVWSASKRGSNSEIRKFKETKIEIQRQKRTPQAELHSSTWGWIFRTSIVNAIQYMRLDLKNKQWHMQSSTWGWMYMAGYPEQTLSTAIHYMRLDIQNKHWQMQSSTWGWIFRTSIVKCDPVHEAGYSERALSDSTWAQLDCRR